MSPQTSLNKFKNPYYGYKTSGLTYFDNRKSSVATVQPNSTKNSDRDTFLSPSRLKKSWKKEIKIPASTLKGGVSRNINKYLTCNSASSLCKANSIKKFQPMCHTITSKKFKQIKNSVCTQNEPKAFVNLSTKYASR